MIHCLHFTLFKAIFFVTLLIDMLIFITSTNVIFVPFLVPLTWISLLFFTSVLVTLLCT